jgi:hypothetical protein
MDSRQKHDSLLFMTENRQFDYFILITMILTAAHDSTIRWLDHRLLNSEFSSPSPPTNAVGISV